ncbi:GNAT family N-acetyltransferase [Roseovarius sp. E0-M6]|uniref:GNAT family N-acetyltransferase n=1 Tax=Roseovarius sp. E0-M6 TaxID=3127118 RepID=UPI0030100DA2
MKPVIDPVTPETLGLLERGLRALATDIGDPFHADAKTLSAALFGDAPACHGLVAHLSSEDAPLGVALYSPVFSTVGGAAGVYVSDLWVAERARGQALGRQLLARVADDGARLWQAGYIRLAAYDDNHGALAAYDSMGFDVVRGETGLRLSGAAFDKIRSS